MSIFHLFSKKWNLQQLQITELKMDEIWTNKIGKELEQGHVEVFFFFWLWFFFAPSNICLSNFKPFSKLEFTTGTFTKTTGALQRHFGNSVSAIFLEF